MNNGIVNIRGKEYQTVALRVKTLKDSYPDYAIRTSIISNDESFVVMKAEVWSGDFLVATGHAEEKRGAGNINKTSALENCETSAIGRALAAFGLGGTEFASAEEIRGAAGDFITSDQAAQINKLLKETNSNVDEFLKFAKAETVDTITDMAFPACLAALQSKKNKMQREPGSDDS